jgi:Domain of unknown function (DUF5753)
MVSMKANPNKSAATHFGRQMQPNEKVARACDQVFPKRNGWFHDYYEESKTWMPPGFRDWPEIENKALRICVWSPSVIDGLLQAESYAARATGQPHGPARARAPPPGSAFRMLHH